MPTPVVLIGLDPRKYTNGHVSYVVAHAMAASRAGLEPHIFCAAATGEIERTEFGTIHRVATPIPHFLLAQADPRPIANAIVEYLAGCDHEPPFVIHGFGSRGSVAVAAAAQLDRRGIASVPVASAYTAAAPEWRVILRGLRIDHGVRAALFHAAWYPWVATAVARTERRGFVRARVVLVNYDAVARLLRKEYGSGLAIRRISYAPLTAFDPEPGVPSAPPPPPIAALEPADAPLIVSVSRHGPNKGVDVLLRALAALRSDGVRFRACVVGPGRLLEADRRLASRLGLDGSVAIPGMVDDVMPYLRSADVFALPSLGEQSGSVALLEALQSGTAVVASDCDGIPEDVTDGEHALLVPPGEVGALRDALARLIDDPALRAELAARGRERFEERFSADTFVAALRDVYAELGAIPLSRETA
jgi:glycosyltransferase involved in cell wall biosynthesis